MELLYLWVDDYKNIKKQGFSFSPRFQCKYDEQTKELTIEENKEHTSIFSENINVTAVVGENGSGKSSILKMIFHLFSTVVVEQELSSTEGKYGLVFYDKGQYKYITSNFTFSFKDPSNFEKIKNTDTHPYTIHVNYMLDSIKDDKNEDWVDDYYHRNDNYDTPVLLEPYKKNNIINLDILNYLSAQRFDWQFLKGKRYKVIDNFFRPNKVIVSVDRDKIKNKISYLNKPVFGNSLLRVDVGFVVNQENLFGDTTDSLNQKVDALFEDGDYQKINKLYFLLKILSTEGDITTLHNNFYETINKNKGNLLDNLDDIILDNNMEEVFEKEVKNNQSFTFSFKKKLGDCVRFQEKAKNIKKEDLENKEFLLKDKKKFQNELLYYPMWISKKYFEDIKSLEKLSSGEKTYLRFIMMLVYEIEQIKTTKKYKTINFLFDEIELTMHPRWQQKLLHDILDILKNEVDLKFNIIMSSHSPLILSDLPKENVIFLEKGKQVYPEIETFGANIHTLLSHGFFMKEGLMGEFAKEKINETIKFLNKEQSTITDEKEAKAIINKIGEPFLKETLTKLYENDYPPSNEEQIQKLQRRIEELQNANT